MEAQRIVSLIPSATEIIYALGFGDRLVGRSHECDYPAAVRSLPVCTEPKFNPIGTSAEIDTRVKAVLQAAISVYNVHRDILRELQPDVIVTQSQCEVCAVSLKEVERVACELFDTAARVVGLEPNTLADIYRDIKQVAAALGVPERGHKLVNSMSECIASICAVTQTIPDKPTVACIEWIDPIMAAGNWVPELVGLAGGVNLFGDAGKHSPWMQWDALAAADPDVIVVLPCGFDMPKVREEMPALIGKPGWSQLKAVQTGRVYLTDGNQYFNRPGPRLVESLQIFAEIFHPERFAFGHRGSGWEPL